MQSYTSATNPLATEKINKLLMKYSIPAIISFLVSSLYNIVDQIFVGQGVGLLGNAATNVAFPLSTICTALFLLLGIGSASNFNLHMGANRKEQAYHTAGTGITLLFITGIIFSCVVYIFLEPMMILFGATDQVLSYALTYTRIITLGFPFLMVNAGTSHLIRADGSPTYSMLCVMVGAILNTILDPLLIFTFEMGMAGAAWATVAGQFASFSMSVWYLTHFKTFRITRTYLMPKIVYVRSILSLGMASFFNQIAMTLMQVVMNNVLLYYGTNSIYGKDIPLACVGVITKVNMLVFGITIGIAQGAQPIFGFNYGAKNYNRVKHTFKNAALVTFCITLISFAVFQLFPRQIVSIFGEGDELYFQFAERYFRIFMFMTFINGMIPLTSTFFTSIGKATKGIVLSLTRQILFLLPLVVIFPLFMGIDGVMYAGPIADLAAALTGAFLLFYEIKYKMK